MLGENGVQGRNTEEKGLEKVHIPRILSLAYRNKYQRECCWLC